MSTGVCRGRRRNFAGWIAAPPNAADCALFRGAEKMHRPGPGRCVLRGVGPNPGAVRSESARRDSAGREKSRLPIPGGAFFFRSAGPASVVGGGAACRAGWASGGGRFFIPPYPSALMLAPCRERTGRRRERLAEGGPVDLLSHLPRAAVPSFLNRPARASPGAGRGRGGLPCAWRALTAGAAALQGPHAPVLPVLALSAEAEMRVRWVFSSCPFR